MAHPWRFVSHKDDLVICLGGWVDSAHVSCLISVEDILAETRGTGAKSMQDTEVEPRPGLVLGV